MKNSISVLHDSIKKHVSGKSIFIDDILLNDNLLHARVVYSNVPHAKIKAIHTHNAKNLHGVHCVLTSKDIPGVNQMGPVIHDEVCLASDKVECIGQAVVLIAATTEKIAIEASKLITIDYEELESVLSLKDAINKNSLIGSVRSMNRGDIDLGKKQAKHHLIGQLETGAQEHWYLETQISLAVPSEDDEMLVYSSTQHPSETQAIVAEVLGINKNQITIETKRMGGAFGGKETQANWLAAWSSLLAFHCKKPVKLRLSRDDDQKITGKRHPFIFDYEVGYQSDGSLVYLNVIQHTDAGCATDLSFAILERAMLHNDNAYFIPHVHIEGRAYKTNLPSNTAFRGFGGPQGVACIEFILDQIARKLKIDSALVRKINFYEEDAKNVTHYGQKVEYNHLHKIYDQLIKSSDYFNRKKEIENFNNSNEFYKKGIALTPVKFGISFTTTHLNQAGALIHVYTDGSVLISHGGTEMGQGLHTKIAQIASMELGLSMDFIKVGATNTSKVANTSATAASSGTDLNGMAVKNALDQIKDRLIPLAKELLNTNDEIVFENNYVGILSNKAKKIEFKKLIQEAYLKRMHLSASGFYQTPDIGWDKIKGWGKPFNYFTYGMCVSEVQLDVLTGYVKVLRTDILHDCGKSINPNIDIGQIQGAYIQGLGWCTTEECKYDSKGRLLNYSPDTYKIPSIQDIPLDFRVELLKEVDNPLAIRKSKAVAEPPFMYGLSTWLAIKDAISSIKNHQVEPEFKIPATHETILLSIDKLKNEI
ncbi:MAG: xanthine dehydrogenase molybdopterin binding subunit [Flavobacteriia bacterium]|nr:xanthine dehydrogenase molybdopterin binding subunit [Flavobacteriia bacterium]